MEPPVTPPSDLSRHAAVETPENVILEFELAGLGSRAAAAALDTLLIAVLLLILLLGVGWMGLISSLTGSWLMAMVIAASFAVLWGYFVLFEGLLAGGRTPGKRAMGIRVLMDTGHPVTFGAAAVRNLLRLVDAQPVLTYLLGALFVFFDSRHRRIGDLVAGTMVVRDRPEDQRLSAVLPRAERDGRTDVAVGSGAPALSDQEFRFLEQYLVRYDSLAPEARDRLGTDMERRLAPRFPEGPSGHLVFLQWLHQRELDQRRERLPVRGLRAPGAGVGSSGERRSGTGTERFVAMKQAVWEEFREAATQAERRGLKDMEGAAMLRFAATYREVAADLARARTYRADRRVLTYLERVVSAGHNALYGLRGVRRVPLGNLLLGELPGSIVLARPYVVAAFLAFSIPGVVGYALIRESPETAAVVLPDEMIARAESGAARQEEGIGYAETPTVFLPMVASRIVTNNVQVAFGAFAFGAFAGVGTLLVLIFNGLFFGAILGHYANQGVAAWLLTFVAPHGVLELPAIFISGGAGLLIGQAIVAPGDRGRRDALVVNGRLAIRLVAASGCLLLVAGLIEGFLSASDAPVAWKLATSAAATLFLVLYLLAGRAYVRDAPKPQRP